MLLTKGQQINEFVIESDGPIGKGNFSLVYKSTFQKKPAALKICKLGIEAQDIKRFHRENDILHGLLTHDGIIQPYTKIIEENPACFYLMELATHGNLEEYINTNDLSDEDKLSIFKKVCEAIRYAHEKKIVHRDLWWANILMFLNKDSISPKLTDFGRAKDFNIEDIVPYQPQTTPVKGYVVPPENFFKIWGTAELSKYVSSDMYALGVILHFIYNVAPITYIMLINASVTEFIQAQGYSFKDLLSRSNSMNMQLYEQWVKVFNFDIPKNHLTIQIKDRKASEKINQIILKLCHPDYRERYANVSLLLEDIDSMQ